jgi:hypothetical protein
MINRLDADPFKVYADNRADIIWAEIETLGDKVKSTKPELWAALLKFTMEVVEADDRAEKEAQYQEQPAP